MAHRSETFDVVVVGAGPAGASAARAAAEGGARVLLLEEHRQVGRPVQCTGLLSLHGIELTQTPPRLRLRPIRGTFVYAPGGRRIALGGEKVQAYVIERDGLDRHLVARAQEVGVELRCGVKATGWQPGQLRALEPDRGRTWHFRAPVVIGADGPHSRLARWARLPRPAKRLYGVQVVVPHRPEREDFVEVFLGRELAPNFFAWAVPAGPGTARVGLATDRPHEARARLHALLEARYSTQVLSIQGGTIPLGPAPRTVTDGLLLVGDAAGQAKPTSGGGIYTGSLCGRIAGEVAAAAVGRGEVSARALAAYERRWRERLGRELRFGWQAHRLLGALSDAQIDRAFTWLARPEVRRLLVEHGDIDYPSRCARELLKRPALWSELVRLLPAGAWLQRAL